MARKPWGVERRLRRSATSVGLTVAVLVLPLVGPSSPWGIEATSRRARRAVPIDPDLAVEPVPTPLSKVYGAGGDVPSGADPSSSLLDAAGDPGALADLAGTDGSVPSGVLGVPDIALRAYRNAADQLAQAKPGCGLPWSLLAAIGRIESGHAHGGRVDATGRTTRPILGPQLNGAPGIAPIADTDGGVLDGDRTWDRAVGPMQFIPSTWSAYAADGNGDGVRDPHNIFDATAAAGRLLCAGGADLRDPTQRARAVYRYNHSDSYVANVLLWADAYDRRVAPVEAPPSPVSFSSVAPPGTTPVATSPAPPVLPATSPSRTPEPATVASEPPAPTTPAAAVTSMVTVPSTAGRPPTSPVTVPSTTATTVTPPPACSTTTSSPITTITSTTTTTTTTTTIAPPAPTTTIVVSAPPPCD